jgi:murein DD-endopeptidase MepM/ murein hydrolase activator NlpD
LFSKYFTVVVIPQKTSKVSKFKIPVRLFSLITMVLTLALVLWGGMLYDYLSIRTKLFDTTILKDQYNKKEQELQGYKKKLVKLEFELDRLSELYQKLKILTSLEGAAQKALTLAEKKKLKKLEAKAKLGILQIIESKPEKSETSIDNRSKQFAQLKLFYQNPQNIFSRIPNRWPIKGYLSVAFGERIDPFSGRLKEHHGIDISAPPKSPIYASAAGIVLSTNDDTHYGNLLVIGHGNGLVTRYAHLAGFNVEVGQLVKRGALIGTVGNTGVSTSPHLHYEVLLNGVPQNPILYIEDGK